MLLKQTRTSEKKIKRFAMMIHHTIDVYLQYVKHSPIDLEKQHGERATTTDTDGLIRGLMMQRLQHIYS